MIPSEGSGVSPRDEMLAARLQQCRQSLHAGNYLQCYDHAERARTQGFETPALDYLSLLALANAGSTQLALKRYHELGYTESDTGEDWLALEGRLLKDLAANGGEDARTLYLKSGEAYLAAFTRTGGYFTAINAATTLLLSGRTADALALAKDVLARVMKFEPADETDDYYLRVTEAEAALLLGEVDRCRSALCQADRLLKGNLNVRSRCVAQLRLICRHAGIDDTLLSALTLAPVIYVRSPPRAETDLGSIPELPASASFVFVGLSHPAELRITEHFLQLDARVHLVLPAPRLALLDHWQRLHGAGWAMRLSRCLDRADETSVALGFLDHEDDWCAAHVSSMALGLSRLAAKRLGCGWRALESGRVDPHSEMKMDEQSAADGRDYGRRFIGTVFADFVGFSRLSDDEMPLFQSLFMASIAETLLRWREKILLQHTWGDAVHIVTGDAESAADIAAEIHAVVDRLRPPLNGTLAHLELRLAAHYAPAFSGVDPIEHRPTFFGSQLSFAARIEPITPPGMVFVTEAFAARLALEAPERFVVEYAGEIELAKRFGKYRLFSLRRVQPVTG